MYATMMEDVRSHEVAVVVLEGTLALRRVYKNENQIVLMAENPAYARLVKTQQKKAGDDDEK